MQREFKKLKGQINQIKEIAKNSRVSSLYEQESALRKKIRLLKEMEKEGFKDYQKVLSDYEEALELVGKKLLDHYNKKKNNIIRLFR